MLAKIERLMDERGLNPTRLAKMAGVPQSSLHAMLRDGRKPTVEVVAAVARVFGVSLDYLADDARGTPPEPLNAAEAQALKMVRAMKLTEQEVIERLATDPNAPAELELESPPRPKRSRRA